MAPPPPFPPPASLAPRGCSWRAVTKPAAARWHCPGPGLPHTRALPLTQPPLCVGTGSGAGLSVSCMLKEGGGSSIPASSPLASWLCPPQPCGDAFLWSSITCKCQGEVSPGVVPPGPPGSQELPAAWGPALCGGAASPPEPCGYSGQAMHQTPQLAENRLSPWLQGAHQPCVPWDGRAVTRQRGSRLPPPCQQRAPLGCSVPAPGCCSARGC